MQPSPALPWDWQHGGVLELAEPVTRSQLLAGILEADFSDDTQSYVEENDGHLYIVYNGGEYNHGDWWEITIDSPTRLRIEPNLAEEDEGPTIVAIRRLNPARIVSTDPETPVTLDSTESIFITLSKQVTNSFIEKIGLKIQGIDDIMYPVATEDSWIWRSETGIVYMWTNLLDTSANVIELTNESQLVLEQVVTAYDA